MQLGIFAKTFAGKEPDDVMSAARRAGYQAVQYNMACSGLGSMPDEIPDKAADAVRAAAIEHGIAIVAISATYNMIHPDPDVRRHGHEALRVIAGSAHRMGTRLLTLCTGTRDPGDQWRAHPDNDSPEAWDDLLESMAAVVEIAGAHDVDLGIEPELANVVNSAAKARMLIDELNSPRLKVVLDPANLFEVETPEGQRAVIASGVKLLADRIVLAHAKDRDGEGRFVAAGAGVLDYDHYLKCLAHAGFDGPLVTHGLAAAEASDVARFLQQQIAGLPA